MHNIQNKCYSACSKSLASRNTYTREEKCISGWHSSAVGGIAVSQLQGPGFDPDLELQSVRGFVCSSCAYVDSLQVLHLPSSVQKHPGRWTAYAKITLWCE